MGSRKQLGRCIRLILIGVDDALTTQQPPRIFGRISTTSNGIRGAFIQAFGGMSLRGYPRALLRRKLRAALPEGYRLGARIDWAVLLAYVLFLRRLAAECKIALQMDTAEAPPSTRASRPMVYAKSRSRRVLQHRHVRAAVRRLANMRAL